MPGVAHNSPSRLLPITRAARLVVSPITVYERGGRAGPISPVNTGPRFTPIRMGKRLSPPR